MQIDTTAGFCCLDDFCKTYEEWERAGRIGVVGYRQRDHMLSLSERLLIMTMFHNSAYKDFKHFYEHGIKHEYASLFGQTPCYARFVALMKQLLVPFAILLHSLKGEETGIYFAHLFCWQQQTGGVPQPPHNTQPRLQKSGQTRTNDNGMVLRLQASHRHQSQMRNHGGQDQ